MRKSVLVLLLVTTVLLANTEAGWFRRAFSKVKNGIKKAVDKVKDFVKKHGPRIIDGLRRVIGKRSADNPCSPKQEEELQEAELMVQQLAEACPTLGIDPNVGLTAEAVKYAFDASDEDNSGALNEEELALFENIMDTYEECVVMESSKRK